MCDALGIKDDDKRLVRISALLHDLGHGPFSHLFENVMKTINPGHDHIHEEISGMIITRDERIGSILRQNDLDTINDIIAGKPGPGDDLSLMSSIVSGNLDADKLDYLKRDSYHIGAKYGEFDLERIINVLTRSSTEQPIVSVSRKGVTALENYRLSRYLMHAQVYTHHTRLIAELMFLQAMELAIHHEGVIDPKRLNLKDPDFLNYYHRLDDASIYSMVINSDKSRMSKKLLLDITNRKLLKRASHFTINDIKGASALQNLLKRESSFHKIHEEILQAVPQLSRHDVLTHKSEIKIKLYGEADLFYTHKGEDHPISKLSPISSDSEINWFYAFGPPDKQTREKINAALASILHVPPDAISADIR